MNGKELQDKFVEININALWVKGIGMIFMSSYYGCNVAVQGTYNVFSLETSKNILESFSKSREEGDEDPFECWLHGKETNRKYRVL